MARVAGVCALAVICSAGVVVAQDTLPEPQEAAPEHAFLKQFEGEWACDNEAFLDPAKPPLKFKGTMTGRTIGDFWAIVVIKCDLPGQSYHGQGTFGYDSHGKKKYIGTWADSMSEFLWRYEGSVDGDKLVLHSEAPNPADPQKMMKARDTYEFQGPDLIVLTGEMEGPDGKMRTVMKATCRRTK